MTTNLIGWCAMRVDAARRDLPDVVGWLGTTDLEPEHVVGNLLTRPRLRTDLFGRQPWIHPDSVTSLVHFARARLASHWGGP